MNTSEISAIHRAVRLMGSQLNLARQLQVTPVTVNQWLRPAGAKNARPIPPKQCVRIEQVTGGAVTRKDLRPDDYREIWPELADGFASLLHAGLDKATAALETAPGDRMATLVKRNREQGLADIASGQTTKEPAQAGV